MKASRTTTPLPGHGTVPDAAGPYSMPWMDSCYQETLLPGAKWHLINAELCDVLAQYLPKQMSQLQRSVVLAGLLGDDFMVKYFPDVLSDIRSHQDSIDIDQKLSIEATSWLKNQLLKAAREVGCLPDKNTELSDNMKSFVQQTSHTFYVGLNRELYKKEQQAVESMKSELEEEKEKKQVQPKPSSLNKFPVLGAVDATKTGVTSGSKHGAAKQSGAVSPTPSVISRGTVISSIKTERVKAVLYNLDTLPIDQPPATSQPIEFIAESIVKLLERSPKRLGVVAKRLHGRLLPSKLRTFMWTETLYKAEREKLTGGVNVERVLRERFGKTVARHVGELRIPRATQSPIHRLIENAVLETYDNIPALAACKSAVIMKEAIKTLNILYTYDKTYEPYLILWLFPLQIAYSERSSKAGPEHVYELAMHLDILNSSLFMKWAQVYAIADLVMNHIKKNDKDLFDHLERISGNNIEIKAKDFVVELMNKERKEADKMLNKPEELRSKDPHPNLLSDARIYIRKWIGEGFVSVLDTPSIMLVWDQLFLQDWTSTVLQDFALVIIILLRERFLDADDHMSMRSVFLFEPCKLLVADLQKAWLMLHENSPDYLEIAKCNRVRPYDAIDDESMDVPSPIPSNLTLDDGDDLVSVPGQTPEHFNTPAAQPIPTPTPSVYRGIGATPTITSQHPTPLPSVFKGMGNTPDLTW